MTDQTIGLGDRVKDRITSFTGIVTAQSEYLNGCRRFGVQPETLTKDGALKEDKWFDEPTLVLVKKGVVLMIPIGRMSTATDMAQPYAGGPARSGDNAGRA